MKKQKYCLDTNVLIQAWNTYYSMDLAPKYWDILDEMARNGTVLCTHEVKREIEKVDDDLNKWIKKRAYLFRDITEDVQKFIRDVLKSYPRLVDTTKDRSMADPWVIAHALAEKATVVTKEMMTGAGSTRIKIPDVCGTFNVRCINDFAFVREVGITFSAQRRQ